LFPSNFFQRYKGLFIGKTYFLKKLVSDPNLFPLHEIDPPLSFKVTGGRLIKFHLIEIVIFHLIESFNNESFIFYHLIELFHMFSVDRKF